MKWLRPLEYVLEMIVALWMLEIILKPTDAGQTAKT
jgi:hypothetical protein